MPLRHHRVAAGPRLRATRRADRIALSPARPRREWVQFQWRARCVVRHLSNGPAAVTASLTSKTCAPATGMRRVAANLTTWLSLFVRAPRFKEGRLLPPRRRLVLGG